MSIITLKNEFLTVEIESLGAELMRIHDRLHDEELLWNGDPAYWKRRSPVLFPNVGKTYGNILRISGAEYPTSQHGFARDMEFSVEAADEYSVCYLLTSTPETLECYPFDFELRISYRLEGRELRVIWNVKNLSLAEMPFTIGGHPAFRFASLSESKEGYLLRFPGRDKLEHLLLDPASGTALPDRKHVIELEDSCLALNDALFAHDALILDGGQVNEVWLCTKEGLPRVGMRCPGFPNYGVWSVPGAAFVCLEPWMGRCDDCGFESDYAAKANVNLLAPGAVFEKDYSIVVPE